MTENIEQRSDEWYSARCGSLGASQITDAISKSKDGKTPGSTSNNIKARLVVERLTGVPADSYSNKSMEWGVENEDAARLAYEAHTGDLVSEAGLFRHPDIEGSHASPDGLVGDDGLVEIKCPNSTTHIETLKTDKIPTKYMNQMYWQMRCTGRKWCDFVSYDPRMPENLALYVRRIEYDDERIRSLESDVRTFLKGVSDDVEALQAMDGCSPVAKDDAA